MDNLSSNNSIKGSHCILDYSDTTGKTCLNSKSENELIKISKQKFGTNTNNIDDVMDNLRKKTNCEDDKCVMENIEEFNKFKLFYNPRGARDVNLLLWNTHIDEYLFNLEKLVDDFCYGGILIYNFYYYPNLYRHGNIDYIINSYKKNKWNYYAIVFNTDIHGGDGIHWTCLIISIKDNKIYYFDSYGYGYIVGQLENSLNIKNSKTESKMLIWIKNIITKFKELGITLKADFNTTNHQEDIDNTNCGVYCLYVIRSICYQKKSFSFLKKPISYKKITSQRNYLFI